MPAALRSVYGAWTLVVAAWALAGTAAGQETGWIVAWGWNNAGQCNVPSPNSGFVAVAGGYGVSLGLTANGSIVAWGSNYHGQCNVPVPNTGFVGVAGGYTHDLGLKADGSVVGWGTNSYGERNAPAPNSGFVAVAAGWCHSLGLRADGSIVAWGYNYYGQCNVPVPNTGFVAVAAGEDHSLGLKADGSIVAWGRNNYGQCNVPAPNSGFVSISGGGYHTLGLKTVGSIVAWGANWYGQCNVPAPNSGFVAVAAGYGHSLGLKADGSIVAWGDNMFGLCDVPAPNSGFFALAAGDSHNLGLKDCGGGIAPAITQQPTGVVAVCSDGSVALAVAADGTAPLLWRWRKGGTNLTNGGNISGATTATLTINPVGPGDAAIYDCVVTNMCGCTPSNGTTLRVDVAPPSIWPSDQVVCLGGQGRFYVVGFDYPQRGICQWRRGTIYLTDGGNISGATTPYLTINPVGVGDAATDYNCIVTNACGDTISNSAALTVISAGPSITAQPADWSSSCGGSASFSVGASGGPAPMYQWRQGFANLKNDARISGATMATLTIRQVASGDDGTYDCVVTNACGSTASNRATLTVDSAPLPIVGQPSNQAVCVGSSASFTVAASGGSPSLTLVPDGTPAPTYQWCRGAVHLTNGGNIHGATTATLTIDPVGSGDAASNYNCIVGNACVSTISNNATLTISGTGPTITSQPSDEMLCLGGSASFTVVASGTPALTYQWRRGTMNLADGGNIFGANAATLTINPVGSGDAASDYNCVITNSCGSTRSGNATLTVNVAPSITHDPNNQVACSGGSAQFTVTATGATSYQWRMGTTNLTNGRNINGATTATLTINPVGTGDAATNYNCVVTSGCGNTTSDNATLTVNVAPSITDPPSSQEACAGGVASFTVAATGAVTYQWRKGTNNLTNGGNISGATTATLTINPVGPTDASAGYNVMVSNACGGTGSVYASLTVGTGPAFGVQPVTHTGHVGAGTTFSASAGVVGTVSYRWRRNGTNLVDGGNISGIAAATLSINPVTRGDAGAYDVVITDDCGVTLSSAATLWLAGDLNCDGVISFADINPFVLALSGPNEYHAVYPNCDWYSADIDGSGQVSYADINPFVGLLSGN